MGDGGIVTPQAGREITDAQLARWRVEQGIDDLQACRIAQHGEKRGDAHSVFGGQQVAAHRPHMVGMYAASLAKLIVTLGGLVSHNWREFYSINSHRIVSLPFIPVHTCNYLRIL